MVRNYKLDRDPCTAFDWSIGAYWALRFDAIAHTDRTDHNTSDKQISNCPLFYVWVQMPVPPPLVSRVPDHIVNNPLVHPFTRQGRYTIDRQP